VLLVTWEPDGSVRSRSIHQYGSATENPDHPCYDDQASLFANGEMKPTFLNEEELLSNSKVRYQPGENVWNTLSRGKNEQTVSLRN